MTESEKARVDRFAAECERLRRDTYYLNKQHGELTEAQQRALLDEHKRAEAEKSRADNAERELAAAVAALRKYGKHSQLCSVVGGYVGPCTCGFDEVTK